MSQLLHFRLFFICTLLIGSTTFYSCDKDTNISLGQVEENVGVLTMDSMTVNASTHQLIDLPSAGTGVMLVGKSTQPNIGSITSSSYTKLLLESIANDIPSGATFDSVNLVVRPTQNRYYYGDTTRVQGISVHRVTEEIKTKDITTSIDNFNTPVYVTGATIFNNQTFNYETNPLGSLNFRPNVRSIDSLSVKLDNSFGKDLFDKIVANDYNVNTNESLLNYLKGIVIVPNSNNSVLLGLSDTLYVNLNYSYIGSDGFKKIGKKSLVTASKAFQYNNISYDRSGTPFATINSSNRTLNNASTNGQLVVQSGTGLVAQLDIPSLNEFMYEKDIAINKIELVVETTGSNQGFYPNPNSLILLVQNSNGVPVSYIRSPFSTQVQTVPFIAGNETGVNASYTFNLIDYVQGINTTAYKGTSLLLTSSSPSLFNTANTAFIATENGKPKIKLNIVYTKFR